MANAQLIARLKAGAHLAVSRSEKFSCGLAAEKSAVKIRL